MMGELERILGSDRLARPVRQGSKRDPSPIWDTWYEEFSVTDRRRLGRFMGGAVTPDVLATWLGVSVDDALRQWRTACLLELDRGQSDQVDADWEDATTVSWDDIVGPQQVADRLAVQVNTVWQWQKRKLLPVPARVISQIPMWDWNVIETWARGTRRLVETELEKF